MHTSEHTSVEDITIPPLGRVVAELYDPTSCVPAPALGKLMIIEGKLCSNAVRLSMID